PTVNRVRVQPASSSQLAMWGGGTYNGCMHEGRRQAKQEKKMSRLLVLCLCLAAITPAHGSISPQIKGGKTFLVDDRHRNRKRPRQHRVTLPASHRESIALSASRGGSATNAPSIYWAVLANWLYFLSLGFNAVNVQFLVREIIDGKGSKTPSSRSIALSGQVESVDKLLTFLGIGFLSALSDKLGRRTLMAWSAGGFLITNLLQARTKSSPAMLYLADFVDGCSSCMTPVCQAFIADVSDSSQLAGNLGIFQGLSVRQSYIFPRKPSRRTHASLPCVFSGGVLGAKFGPRLPLLIAAGIQAVNLLVILLLTPESLEQKNTQIDLKQSNPLNGMKKLFFNAPLLRTVSLAYFLSSLARGSLDAQFSNYSNIRFGWTQAQSGPVLVLVGIMLAIIPRFFISRFGVQQAILVGLLTFALGLTCSALAPSPGLFVLSIAIVSFGCMSLPALQSVVATLASPGEKGVVLGALGATMELTGAIGSTAYAAVLSKFAGESPLLGGKLPGAHFLVGALLLLFAYGISLRGLIANKNHPALTGSIDSDVEV
ncbi:hypothetical protein THAOC_17158, partial [Thalassiosira oceanica]